MKKTEAQLSETINSWQIVIRGAALVAVMGLAGCVDSEEDTINERSSAADIAQESADNYDDNVNGLISGSTLDSWINDWEANRPDGITGNLVILQVSTTYMDDPNNTPDDDSDDVPYYYYIDGSGDPAVRVYAVDTNRLIETRSNGVIETRSMVPSGESVDQWLADYDIDPTEDMIVWAMGSGGMGEAMRQGRGWYMLRYWGAEKEHLALLNGGANHSEVMNNVVADAVQDTALTAAGACDESVNEGSCLPGTGTVSVRDLPENNTVLQATLGDVMDVATGKSDAFLWDARSAGEYHQDAFRNAGSKQGHPNNAVLLPFSHLLVTGDAGTNTRNPGGAIVNIGASYKYKPKADLESYMAGNEVDGGQFQRYYSDSDTLEALRSEDIYQDGQVSITYCETTYRAMITGVATAVVLGMPNRFYDGAMVEWNSMSHIQDKNNNFLLPNDSPWRTDKASISHYEYNDPANIDPRTIDDPYANHTNAIPNADIEYKSGSGGSDGGGDDGGGSLPSNPCGG